MADIKKLVKAWEIFRDSNPYGLCSGREFRAIREPEYCMGQMIADTIDLLESQMERLKRQENAKRPTDVRYFQHGYIGNCPYCRRCVDFAQKYCHNCTQLLDWQEVMEVAPKDGDGE